MAARAAAFVPPAPLTRHLLIGQTPHHLPRPARHRPLPHRRARASASASSPPGVSVRVVPTSPIAGQKTGTSGLRVRTAVVSRTPHFVENLVQSLFTSLGGPSATAAQTLVVGGDGRFYNLTAVQTIIRLAAGNGFARVLVGRDGLLSTPAAAALIKRAGALAGVLLTASHNPGGADADWGIKFNTASGAPAQDDLTDAVCAEAACIGVFRFAEIGADVDLSATGVTRFGDGMFAVDVVDPADVYVDVLREVFDFAKLRVFVGRPDFSLLFDAMHAVTGVYAHRVLVDELGAPSTSILRGTPLPDFGGGHPDPNLTYAAGLLLAMRADPTCAFGAASDGDGDRNMIVGPDGLFVNPSDSVAIIAAHASCIPWFQKHGLPGVARSMPTASALDRVADAAGIPCYETPTGWKYFASLLDSGRVGLCGEESFGTGSPHVPEKDGLWAVLAWLSILAEKNAGRSVGELVSVKDVLVAHWRKYGRTYALRHDFENVSADAGAEVMAGLRKMVADGNWPEAVERMDEFRYEDPVTGAIAERQGVRMWLKAGGRVVVRLSGTGSSGATVRVYYERYEAKEAQDGSVKDPSTELADLVEVAMQVARIESITGRSAPTVIT